MKELRRSEQANSRMDPAKQAYFVRLLCGSSERWAEVESVHPWCERVMETSVKEPETTLVVPDTNTLLHFRLFDELPWGQIARVQHPVLALVWPVVRELDKLKSDPRTRDRARTVLTRIEELFAESDDALLRSGIPARFFHAEGILGAMRDRGLDAQIGDDIVLGSVLALHASQHPVVLATDDSGMRLRARAYGVLVRPMPQEHRLNSADPLLAENARLRRENEDLKLALPRLEVVFSEGTDSIRVVRPPIPVRNSQRTKDALALMPLRLDRLPSAYEVDLERPTKREVDDYNAALEKFRPEYEKYVAQRTAYEHFPYLSVLIALEMRNSGGRAAEELKLVLTFPNTIEVVTVDHIPKEPPKPEGPELPGKKRYFNDLAHLVDQFAMPREFRRPTPGYSLAKLRVASASEPSAPEVSSGDDGAPSVTFQLGVLSNFDDVELPPFHVRFRTLDTVGSFHFTYNLRSHSLPRLLAGKLHVRIERSNEDSK